MASRTASLADSNWRPSGSSISTSAWNSAHARRTAESETRLLPGRESPPALRRDAAGPSPRARSVGDSCAAPALHATRAPLPRFRGASCGRAVRRPCSGHAARSPTGPPGPECARARTRPNRCARPSARRSESLPDRSGARARAGGSTRPARAGSPSRATSNRR